MVNLDLICSPVCCKHFWLSTFDDVLEHSLPYISMLTFTFSHKIFAGTTGAFTTFGQYYTVWEFRNSSHIVHR